MPPLLYDPPDLRHYTAGLDPPTSAWPGACDNARRPKPKATRKPRPRSGPSAIVTTETGAGPSAWRARRHRGQRLALRTLRNGCLNDRDQGTCPGGPKRGMPGLAKTLRGRRPRIGPQWPPTLSLEAPAGSFRGHGVSLARRGLVRRINPCNADTMPSNDRTRVQLCVWGVGYAGAATGPCGLTMGRRGKTAHAALERAAARSRDGLNDPTPRAEKGKSA